MGLIYFKEMKVKLKHQSVTVKISDLVYNRGQLEGLPSNPRFVRDESFELMKKSIRDTPELLELRPPIVYPLEPGALLVIAGEMRSRAAKFEGHKKIPVIILDSAVSVELLKEITIKDNAHFGEWDMDELANSWGDGLAEWGVNSYWDPISADGIDNGLDRSKSNNKSKGTRTSKELYNSIVLSYKPADYDKVMAAFDAMKGTPEQIVFKLLLK